ncbi:MAG: helix-turn-helix transcriptional regulator [Methylobacter sp.]|nr:helix-turn-helix transcriptional regulator [Methylobacter sp.]
MTPFGKFLEIIRRSRQLQQKQLAVDLGINASYISALEKGRKEPLSKQVLERLITSLELDDEEQATMWKCGEQSKRTLHLPDGMMLAEYELVSQLRQQLGRLSQEQITLMMNVLALNTSKNKQSNMRRIDM